MSRKLSASFSSLSVPRQKPGSAAAPSGSEWTVQRPNISLSSFTARLMPTWLEWLRANQALVWGSGLGLLGLLTAVGRWWRGK